MTALRVVLDTNVLVAAARSRLGASFAIVSSIPAPEFQPCLSVGLYAEWQEVLTRSEHLPPGQTAEDAWGFVRYLASQSHLQEIHFLWRPYLADADDEPEKGTQLHFLPEQEEMSCVPMYPTRNFSR